jgi:hypothetical protein
MSAIHMKPIAATLDRIFRGKIDLTDVSNRDMVERKKVFYTRALAAFGVMHLAGVDPDAAALAITDGANDDGIDLPLPRQEAPIW